MGLFQGSPFDREAETERIRQQSLSNSINLFGGGAFGGSLGLGGLGNAFALQQQQAAGLQPVFKRRRWEALIEAPKKVVRFIDTLRTEIDDWIKL